MFASSSRLDVCLFLKPRTSAHMKTLMTTNPLVPIVIKYDTYMDLSSEDMDRLLSALKRPGRIREIDLRLNSAELDKIFKSKATKCRFPALESLAICDRYYRLQKIPATFLKGTNLHLRLRSLKLDPISLESVSRLLSSATALTDLSLKFNRYCQANLSGLLPQLQGLPHLRRLDLTITRFTNYSGQLSGLTEPKDSFPLTKLTSFHYGGHSEFLDFLMMGFEAPSLQDIVIHLNDPFLTLHSFPHLPRFFNGAKKHYHAAHFVLKQGFFVFSLLAPSEGVGHNSLRFRLPTPHPPPFRGRKTQKWDKEWMMEVASAFSAKLSTVEELALIKDTPRGDGFMPWCTILKQFPSVKEFRIEGVNNHRVAGALQPYRSGANLSVLPALERITLCISLHNANRSSELAVFQPFVTARQQVGRQVQVTCFP